MVKGDFIISIVASVYSYDYCTSGPRAALIRLTREELDALEHLSVVVVHENIKSVSKEFSAAWFNHKPLLDFSELGNKFISVDLCHSLEFNNIVSVEDNIYDSKNFNSQNIIVLSDGFYIRGVNKFSKGVYKTAVISFDSIISELTKPEDTAKHDYYFPEDPDYPKDLKGAYYMVGSDNMAMAKYCQECIKIQKGGM